MVATTPKTATNKPVKNSPKLDPNAPMGSSKPPPAASDKPMIASASDDTPVETKKKGFFGRIFGSSEDKAPEESPKPEIIELASNTPSASATAGQAAMAATNPAKTADNSAAAKSARDNFEFQFSPIPRHKK
jgi:hypothetical protein